MKLLRSVSALLLCLGLVTCVWAASPAAPRVVSVGGGVTEIVYALGAEAQLVGTDTSSTWPAAARALPQVGYQRTLSAEGVLSLQPQVLLASHEAGPPHVLDQLHQAGIRVVRVDGAYSFEGLQERVRRVSAALGQVAAGEALVADLARRWQAVRQQVQAQPPRNGEGAPLRVALLMSHGGMNMASGDQTAAAALLEMVGVRNAFAGQFREYKPLSAESLAAAAPDVIIVAVTGPEPLDPVAFARSTAGVGLTPAGRSGRILGIDIVRYLGFGPRLPEAVADLHQKLLQP